MDDGVLGKEYRDGEEICRQGDHGDRMYVVQQGGANVFHEEGGVEVLVGELKAGDIFGEMAIFDQSERSTDAIANTDCTLYTITRSDFELLMDFNRDIAYKVLWAVTKMLSSRLRQTNDNLRSFLAMSMF